MMKKLVPKKNRTFKSVNNHKIQIYHKLKANKHIVNGGIKEVFDSLAPIYQELEREYCEIDLIDLVFYERWLNE